MNLPEDFDAKLSENPNLKSRVLAGIQTIESWLKQSRIVFFPEYTDHGINHIESVLATAWSIANDESREIMTAEDAAVVLLSGLLHDSAMHLTEDSFRTLIETCSKEYQLSGFSDPPWSSVWQDYLSEASRWDDRKLIAIFGRPEAVRIDSLDKSKLTGNQRLMIGEFLRRHHPRLAHEIAIFGVPGHSPDIRLRFEGIDPDLLNIAGLVARSHGMNVRDCFAYLEKSFGSKSAIREVRRTHPTFLMCLLRIADYLQIQSDRAPKSHLTINKLRSPISEREWDVHDAVPEIRNTHDDPEAVFVEARPQTVSIYLKLKKLLESIQREIDHSWAVLGEVYASHSKLNKLGLTLRRIRSNIEDKQAFSLTVNYEPDRFAFDASSADLLKLLIEPLYENRPEVGIRELVQNSVDAVRELELYYRRTRNKGRAKQLREMDSVIISIERESEDTCRVVVQDGGIGMSLEVLKSYFLKAGATFRKSDRWRKDFEDGEGKSRVLRSGRFGVGVLAAFLIGDKIAVETRHVTEERGFYFEANLETETIEVRKCDCQVGTKITVHAKKTHIEELIKGELRPDIHDVWDWHCLSFPKVKRILFGQPRPQHYLLPSPLQSLPCGWHRIEDPAYQDIQWSFKEAPDITLNGILLQNTEAVRKKVFGPQEVIRIESFNLVAPNISVFDPDSKFPVNLQRSKPLGIPFQEKLKSSVIHDFCAYLLAKAPQGPVYDPKHHESYWNITYAGIRVQSLGRMFPMFGEKQNIDLTRTPIIATPSGSAFFTNYRVKKLGYKHLLLFPPAIAKVDNFEAFQELTDCCFACVLVQKHPNSKIAQRILRFMLTKESPGVDNFYLQELPATGVVLLANKRILELGLNSRLLKEDKIRTIWETDRLALIGIGERFRSKLESVDLKKVYNPLLRGYQLDNYPFFVAEWFLNNDKDAGERSLFDQIWDDVFNGGTIPFNTKERTKLLKSSSSKLKDYLHHHQ